MAVNTPEDLKERDKHVKIMSAMAKIWPEDGEPKLCCTIEADTWEEAMTKYYEHMGWGKYTPQEGE